MPHRFERFRFRLRITIFARKTMIMRPDTLIAMKRIEIVIDEEALGICSELCRARGCARVYIHQAGGRARVSRRTASGRLCPGGKKCRSDSGVRGEAGGESYYGASPPIERVWRNVPGFRLPMGNRAGGLILIVLTVPIFIRSFRGWAGCIISCA